MGFSLFAEGRDQLEFLCDARPRQRAEDMAALLSKHRPGGVVVIERLRDGARSVVGTYVRGRLLENFIADQGARAESS